ncbi:MAG: cation-translocating P-type ATPase [Chitinophagaceae bacterium]|nr:cation-translocating P-type ATPase [Chitinophagaceae bacterium]
MENQEAVAEIRARRLINNPIRYLFLCLPFTIVLFLPPSLISAPLPWISNPWYRLLFCLPVLGIGFYQFGTRALSRTKDGLSHRYILFITGFLITFLFSLYGTITHKEGYWLGYEVTAGIITLLFWNEYLEYRLVLATQKRLKLLHQPEKTTANMIAFDGDHQEVVLPIDNHSLHVGDLILIQSGGHIPADCKILSGEASVNESVITGYANPVSKKPKDKLTGGAVLITGSVKAQVTATADQSLYTNMIKRAEQALSGPFPFQNLAGTICRYHFPLVTVLAVTCFVLNFCFLHDFLRSLTRSIAVLFISNPYLLRLGIPAILTSGIARGLRRGIIFNNIQKLKYTRDSKQIIFLENEGLTTGELRIKQYNTVQRNITQEAFRQITYSLVKYSDHPLAICIKAAWKTKHAFYWNKIEEKKGWGIRATDKEGNEYFAGTYQSVASLTTDKTHDVYVLKNNEWLGWIDVPGEIRPESRYVTDTLKERGITLTLLTGENELNGIRLGAESGIDKVLFEPNPKLRAGIIATHCAQLPAVIVGSDPDIPHEQLSYTKTTRIALCNDTPADKLTADITLVKTGLRNLPLAVDLSKRFINSLQQHIAWFVLYNVSAILLAAFGLLGPVSAVLIMSLSILLPALIATSLYKEKSV